MNISIHAPAKGATPRSSGSILMPVISIHAPAKGATIRASRRPGCARISIHAPAKGATVGPKLSGRGGLFQSTFPRRERPRTYEKPFPVSTYFNPRSREGSDSLVPNRIYCTSSFQSTLPRRERRDWMTARHPSSDFNPRSREGSDRIGVVVVRVEAPISIHAPAKGATLGRSQDRRHGRISIHAPAKGATLGRSQDRRHGRISIHAPAKGATWPCLTCPARRGISIHAPAKGATNRRAVQS